MNLLVMENHSGEGEFPLFKKGTTVSEVINCENTPYWCSCLINGHNTYIPETYISDDGKLIKDYNPTELVVEKGQQVTLLEVVFEWLYVKDEKNNDGWIPSNKVISV